MMAKGFEPLFVAQYDDDPYCAPYAKYIFTNKEQAIEFAKRKDEDFRCITEFEYKPEFDRYIEKIDWYILNDEVVDGNTYYDYLEKGEYNE